jgi:hypothetical protein
MKKVCQINMIFCFLVLSTSVYSQNIPPKTDSIPLADINKYLKKEVYLFLLDDRIREYKSIQFFSEPPFTLSGVVILLKDMTELIVYIEKPKYQKLVNLNLNWSMELFYKEIIYKIEVRESTTPTSRSAPKW